MSTLEIALILWLMQWCFRSSWTKSSLPPISGGSDALGWTHFLDKLLPCHSGFEALDTCTVGLKLYTPVAIRIKCTYLSFLFIPHFA